MRRNLLLPVVLLITFLVYLPVLRFEFVYDDILISLGNPGLRWAALPGFFVHSIWGTIPGLGSNYYRPLANSWVLLNFKLFGLRAWGFHLTSILVHLFATTLVFLTTRKLTKDDQFIPAAATLMFALHPLHAEAVSWISAFGDPWMSACVLSSLFYFLRSREEPAKQKWLVYSLLWFAAGLLFKETAIVLVGVIAAYLWINRRTFTTSRGWNALAGFVMVAAMYLLLRRQVLHSPVQSSNLGWTTEILTWPEVFWFYLGHLFFPYHLSTVYYLNYVNTFELKTVVFPLVATCAIVGVLYQFAKPAREIAATVALLLLVLPILPALHLRLFRWRDLAHDRYLYLPSVGFCILVALLLARLPRLGERSLFGQPALRVLLLASIVGASVFGLAQEIRPFTNNYTLSARAVEVGPDDAPMLWIFAGELEKRGDTSDALSVYHRLAKLVPQSKDPLISMARIELQQKDYRLAREHLLRSLQLATGDFQAYYLLGRAFEGEQNYPSAEQSFRKAAEMAPHEPGVHELISHSLQAQGKNREAQEEHKRELELNSVPR